MKTLKNIILKLIFGVTFLQAFAAGEVVKAINFNPYNAINKISCKVIDELQFKIFQLFVFLTTSKEERNVLLREFSQKKTSRKFLSLNKTLNAINSILEKKALEFNSIKWRVI